MGSSHLPIAATSMAGYCFYQYVSMSCVLCSYEPELFPGLIYRMVRPRIVLLIFVSGKVVLTGKFVLICCAFVDGQF